MVIKHTLIFGMVVCAICSMSDAFGVVMELSAGDASAVWTVPVSGFDSVNADRNGSVIPDLLGETEESISIDFLSQSDNRNGWGLFGAGETMIPDQDMPWTILGLSAGDKVLSSPAAHGWDAGAWLDQVLDVGLTNSNLARAWNLGRLANDGIEIGGDNIYLDNIEAIPEPATYGLITIFGGGLLLFRRRFKL